jgi:hypothetical protein
LRWSELSTIVTLSVRGSILKSVRAARVKRNPASSCGVCARRPRSGSQPGR